jgi:hypothetical protein
MPFEVIDWNGSNNGTHGTREAAEKRVRRLVAMSNGYRKESDFTIREVKGKEGKAAKDARVSKVQLRKAIEAGREELKHQEAALNALEVECDEDVDLDDPDADVEVEAVEPDEPTEDSGHRVRFAMDKRMETIDGHLVVTGCNITKANVCPYLGSEIPGAEKMGLDPSKIYMLYRDGAEIEAAIDTYNRIPLLMQHVAVSADQPQQFLTVGTISNARFRYPYAVADLTVWTRDGIELIQSGRQRELSCGYRYVPDMTPGHSPDGTPYDGRMTQIVANHIALVEAGRAGPDVHVADSVLQIPTQLT